VNELYDLCLDLITIYTYTSDIEDIHTLRKPFDTMAKWINDMNRGFIVNPSALSNIDKRRDKILVYNPKMKLDESRD
jgi:hypothetical protein